MDKPNTATIADIIVIIALTLLNPMLFPQMPPPTIPDKVVKYYKPQLTADSIQHAIALTEKEIDEMSYYLRLHNVMDDGYNLVAEYNTTLQQRLKMLKHQLSNPKKPKAKSQKLKWLCTSPDPVKDQTDFLAQIYDWQLEKALFPIGHMMKEEVREIAEREHLAPAHRRDSQGICFLGKINYNDYIRRYLGELPGDVIELETGKKIGQHKGHWFHTIGQRKGMGLGGGPWFVIKKDIEQNIIYVSHGYDPESAYKQDFPIRDFHSINGVLPPENITLKIRHTPEYLPARLEAMDDGRYIVHAAAPIHGVAPGQFCVIYDAQHHRCYGSGEITI